MFDHPERAPRNGAALAGRIGCAVVLMTVVAVSGAAVFAVCLLAVYVNPFLLAGASVATIVVTGWAAGVVSRWIKP